MILSTKLSHFSTKSLKRMSGNLKIRFYSISIRSVAAICLLFLLVSCKNNSGKIIQDIKPGEDKMAELNKYFIQKDKERIQNYIERKKLDMTESPAGLWYQILIPGEGNKFTDNDKVILDYECFLLDGTKCYSSETLGPKELILGRSEIEPGMNEGLRMLRPGAEAIFILPPNDTPCHIPSEYNQTWVLTL